MARCPTLASIRTFGYRSCMRTLRARVSRGRVIVDEPTDLPDGTELELIVDRDDDLDEAERAALNASLDRSFVDAAAGRVRPAQVVLADLRGRR